MVGSRILHYQITQLLGAGGMGEVYLAEDTRLHRPVALKFLHPMFRQNPEMHDRLVREARSASQLSHPGIVAIHAIEETPEHMFIVMEYAEGRSLRDLARTGAIDLDTALDYARQILLALSAAHDAGIIHRDIKSDNIVVTEKGPVKILDFGLARSGTSVEVTQEGSSSGTPAYMSPEQIQGEKADKRSDLFSFGVVLYEMITGRLPFRGEHASAVNYSIVNESPPPLTAHARNVPPGLQSVVDKLLAKDRESRYQSASDAIADLDRVRAGLRPTAARRRRIGPLAAIAGAVLVVVAAAVGWLTLRGTSGGQERPESGRVKLVVLPFTNLGPTDHEYFADGVTEEVTTRLAKISGLGVISRTSATKYKKSNKTVREIGSELGVNYVLEGTIRWDQSVKPDHVRINAQLIRVADDTHVWADDFDRVYDQIFTVQSDIAENVAAALNVALLKPEEDAVKAKPTSNLEAYDFYLKARQLNERATTLDDYRFAVEMMERAIQMDSTFAGAHAQLARYYTNDYFNSRFPEEPRLEQGRKEALAALRHAPEGPEGHVAMGYYYYYGSRDYRRALEEFALAKAKEPNNSDLLQAMAYVQRRQGNWEEAYANLKLATDLDPTSLEISGAFIETAMYMRRYDEAERHVDKALSQAPDRGYLYALKAMTAMLATGNVRAARATLTQAETRAHGPDVHSAQLNLDWLTGDYEAVLRRLPSLVEIKRDLGVVDTANYYLTKGFAYTLKAGLYGESATAHAYFDSARTDGERRLKSWPEDPMILIGLAMAHAGLRQKDKAYACAQRAADILPLSRDAVSGGDILFNQATIEALFGDADAAVDKLEVLLRIPSTVTPKVLEVNPLFEPIRNHPRFQRLLREKNAL
jgi:TolB-like protein/Tfp pilus assembly protein PilF/predicted Ser/Thr protein kinase